ncbi:GNAT family N-acetyltransferase [Salidesulfovibrio brasiliensis]|uniref:GNAT family N-acetyltransferase n=1 Tax=Salidesulfovibrio brasiliensis TaxID=221711 RepID=UPI0006D256EB|nr:N-acetyltransferase [Salidesulfovibrio brasiliensis]
MIIRNEHAADLGSITEIHYAAFKDHPQHEPGAEPTEHRIVERLRDAGALAFSLVAEVGGEPVGHIALSPTLIGNDSSGWFLLGPVGVQPEHQGKGIGSALVREAIRLMRESGAAGIALIGNPGFYGRFGFVCREGLTFKIVPPEYVLALSLNGSDPQGEVGHHEAFGLD